MALNGLKDAGPDRILNASRILELANKAHYLYLRENPVEQGKLLKIILSNCALDGATLCPHYRKPFGLIFHAAQNEKWLGREDLNLRPTALEPNSIADWNRWDLEDCKCCRLTMMRPDDRNRLNLMDRGYSEPLR